MVRAWNLFLVKRGINFISGRSSFAACALLEFVVENSGSWRIASIVVDLSSGSDVLMLFVRLLRHLLTRPSYPRLWLYLPAPNLLL